MHVMQQWTAEISHRQQGVIVLALRGPDGLTKESGCKNVIRTFRACTMNSGEQRRPLQLGEKLESKLDNFMTMQFISDRDKWTAECERFVADVDTYNVHFLQHFLHAAMVLAFNHPSLTVRDRWQQFVERLCNKLHIKHESRQEFTHRLRDGLRTEQEELA